MPRSRKRKRKRNSLSMEPERRESVIRVELAHNWLNNIDIPLPDDDSLMDRSLHSFFNLETHFDSSPEMARWWTPEFESRIDSILESVAGSCARSLREIRLRHCSDRSVAFVAGRCPNLEVLAIRSCPRVTGDPISGVAFSWPNLRELDISYCYQISHQSLRWFGGNCPNLKVLKRNFRRIDPSQHVGVVPDEYLNAVPQDGDAVAAAIANSMPLLERLEIRFCNVSSVGFDLLCQQCGEIRFLDLTGCTNLTNRDVKRANAILGDRLEVKGPEEGFVSSWVFRG